MSLLLLLYSYGGVGASGKRRDFPSYIPEPAYEAQPSKPFRPVWDKPNRVEVEQRPQPPAAPRVAQLPPQSIFGDPQDAPALSDFSQYAIPDVNDLAQRLRGARDTQDLADAIRVLQQVFKSRNQ